MRHIQFSYSKGLAKGLRPNSRVSLEEQGLTSVVGMFPENGVLKSPESFTIPDISASIENCSFPYPQYFTTLDNSVIVCTATKIYEQTAYTALTLKLQGLATGGMWTLADFYGQLYLGNGQQIVMRNPESGVWSVGNLDFEIQEAHSSYITKAATVCANHGQLIIGNYSVS